MLDRLGMRLRARSSRAGLIPFSDVKPSGSRLAWLWHGLGMDDQKNIYIAIGNGQEMHRKPGDVLIFQYDTKTGQKRYLDSVRGILAAENNLGPNEHWPWEEGVAKVHSDIIQHNGKMYFSTHDLHHAKNLKKHRGGHFVSFELSTRKFKNLSLSNPLGVAVEHEGIIALNVLQRENLLVGWTYPFGHVLLHDLETGETTKCASGFTGNDLTNIARVIVTTIKGSVFASYSGPGAPDCFFKLNREQERLLPTKYRHAMGFIEGMAQTSDGRTIFLADTNGELYSLDTDTEVFTRLGSILPHDRQRRGERVMQLRNLTMSCNEQKLFTIPTQVSGGSGAWHLYEYVIATGEKSAVANLRGVLKNSMLTGNGVMDEAGYFYLSCYFGSDAKMYRRYGGLSGLARIDVSDRYCQVKNSR